jgi:ABC-type transport system involved in multi-copper enzyme maturation permease subunit
VTARLARFHRLPLGLGSFATGVAAIGVKELRGRMRGKRAYVILTLHLAALGAFAWVVESLMARSYSYPGASMGYASASIGQGVFTALLLLQTALVVLLAPAATAGAISLEREKQTLDMLTTTPISAVAIVVGKLFSALVYVFLLILASIPLMALVFVYGGVAPDDLVRGYVVLVATAIGFGTVGIFFSALARRTQAATMLSFLTVIVLVVGITFAWFVVDATNRSTPNPVGGVVRDSAGNVIGTKPPPEQFLWLNPYFAQADVLCGALADSGAFCSQVWYITTGVNQGFQAVPEQPMPAPAVKLGAGGAVDIAGPGVVVSDVVIAPQVGVTRDVFWPKYIAAWLVVSVILIGISVRLVSPAGGPAIRRPALRRGSKGAGSDAPA